MFDLPKICKHVIFINLQILCRNKKCALTRPSVHFTRIHGKLYYLRNLIEEESLKLCNHVLYNCVPSPNDHQSFVINVILYQKSQKFCHAFEGLLRNTNCFKKKLFLFLTRYSDMYKGARISSILLNPLIILVLCQTSVRKMD